MRTAALPSSFQLATVRGSRAPRTTSTPPLSPSCATMAPPFNPLAPSTRTRGRSDPLSRSPMMISSSLKKTAICLRWRNSLPRTTGTEREIRLQARTAVGRDLGAVDVAGRVRDQKGDKFRDFVCLQRDDAEPICNPDTIYYLNVKWYLNGQQAGAFALAVGSGQRLALREKLQQGADHPACGAACARFRLRVLQAETMRQSGHAAGKVSRVHGKGDGLGFEEALEDSRQRAGLLILQRVISFCEDGISARMEL